MRRKFLGEKLPDKYTIKDIFNGILTFTDGAIELHRLATSNLVHLEMSVEEIIGEEIINATCSVVSKSFQRVLKEVRQLLPSQIPPQVTPLWLACYFTAEESALLLLNRGADPNKGARRSNGFVHTPLYWAAFYNLTAVCKSLLARGARLDLGGRHLLLFCHHRHHHLMITLLISSANWQWWHILVSS